MANHPDAIHAQARIKFQTACVLKETWSTCITCDHWSQYRDPKDPVAKCQKFDAVPPLSVIVVGCPQWEPGIPF